MSLVDFSMLATHFGLCGADSDPENSNLLPAAGLDTRIGVTLTVDPHTATVDVGDVFDVIVRAEAGMATIDGAAAYLDFDPSLLEVVSLTPGDALPLVIVSAVEPAGHVNFAAGTVEDFPSGTITVATVRFRALAPTPVAAVIISNTSPRLSDVTFAGTSVLAGTESSSIIIEVATGGTPSPTPTATTTMAPGPPTLTPTATATSVGTAPPTVAPCAGDCNRDGVVAVDELVTAINIVLAGDPPARCSALDSKGDGQVTIEEVVAAVDAAVSGCAAHLHEWR